MLFGAILLQSTVLALVPAALFRWLFGEKFIVYVASAVVYVGVLFGIVYVQQGYIDGLMVLFLPAYFLGGLLATLCIHAAAVIWRRYKSAP